MKYKQVNSTSNNRQIANPKKIEIDKQTCANANNITIEKIKVNTKQDLKTGIETLVFQNKQLM